MQVWICVRMCVLPLEVVQCLETVCLEGFAESVRLLYIELVRTCIHDTMWQSNWPTEYGMTPGMYLQID